MKKITATIISAVLICMLMTSCSVFTKEEETEPHEDIWFSLSSLPEKTQYKNGEIRESFFTDGVKDEFEPSTSYGVVVPYFGNDNSFSDGENERSAYIGFASADGRIITNGIYDYVYQISSPTGRRIYECSRKTEDGAVLDFITESGSVLISSPQTEGGAIKSENFFRMPCECILIPTESGACLYDMKGSLIINLTEAFGADCYFNVAYCDGEKIIFSAAANMGEEKSPGAEYYCVNKEGTLLYELNLDSFSPIGFEGGRFFLIGENNKMRLADVLGNLIDTKDYDEILYDSADKYFWGWDSSLQTLDKFTADGEIVMRKQLGRIKNAVFSIMQTASGYSSIFVQNAEDEKSFRWFSTQEGEDFEIETGDILSVAAISENGCDRYIEMRSESGTDIFDATGTYITTIADCLSIRGISGKKLLYIDSQNRFCCTEIGRKGTYKITLPQGDAKTASLTMFSDRYVIIESSGGEKSLTGIYDISEKTAVTEGLENATAFTTKTGTFICAKLNGKYTLLRETGERLISLSDDSLV